MSDPRATAIELLDRHRPRIAKAVTRQVRQLVPKYEDIDVGAHEKNAGLILELLQRLVGGEPETALLKAVNDLMRLRAAVGFTTRDFVIASHCFLPVIRRFFMETSSDLQLANAAYDEVEERTLALMGRLIAAAFEVGTEADGDVTAPNRPSIGSEAPWLADISIESV